MIRSNYRYQQTPQQQVYAQNLGPLFMPNPGFANPREMGVYRAPGPLSQNIPPSGIGNMPSFALSQLARPEYSQG